MALLRPLCAAILTLAAASLPAQDRPKVVVAEDGAVPLFNGKDLAGWVNVNCHPGTFFVKDGEIVTTGTPTGFLRTEKQYENFVLEMDWMHVNKKEIANSGLFVWGDPLPSVGTPYTRGIEVQVLINYPKVDWATNHGDIFSIHGARCVPDRPHPKGYERCLPSEERVKGGGEWNHYKVTANDGAIKLEVNGKEVSGVSRCTPRKGYLALESEGAECHFKNIRLKELPSTNPKPEEVAKVWEGHASLFTGLDLKGWKTEEGAWKAAGGVLKCVGKANILTEAKFGNCELVFDWRRPAKATEGMTARLGPFSLVVGVDGETILRMDESPKFVVTPGEKVQLKPGAWNRSTMTFDGTKYNFWLNGKNIGAFKPEKAEPVGPLIFERAEGLEIMNVFVRELKEKK